MVAAGMTHKTDETHSTTEPVKQEKHPHIKARSILDRIVLGGSDGVIEGIAATSALNGANVAFGTIILAALALAIAGAVSMFFSSYLSARSTLSLLRRDIEREKMEIETEPEEERTELEQMLRKEGYSDKEVGIIVNRITRDKDMWLKVQLIHELHLHAADILSNPLTKSAPAGIAFFLGALIPLVPYLFSLPHYVAMVVSVIMALVGLFTLGSTKFVSLKQLGLREGLEMAAIGAGAAMILYVIGRMLSYVRI